MTVRRTSFPNLDIVVEHVRTFDSEQRIPIRPLTILLGENSSGKSSLLALISAILDPVRFPTRPAFNEPPYSLGTFDTIATYKGGRYGRATQFCIGFTYASTGDDGALRLLATYTNDSGTPALARVRATTSLGEVDLRFGASGLDGEIRSAVQPNRAFPISVEAGAGAYRDFRAGIPFPLPMLLLHLFNSVEQRSESMDSLMKMARELRSPLGPCQSLAPIRSKPRRTYDQLGDDYSPEGDHVPSILARVLERDGGSRSGRRVIAALDRFGQLSGLYRKVDIRRLGKQPTDPCQVQVTVAGPPANLADVGYGISQALPVVVESALRSARGALLIQQPEVHLHPRAQAALGTFLVDVVQQDPRMIVIETHSDHLVDRVRQHVASGQIDREDVCILFFDKPALETHVHRIELDERGNVAAAPPSYRQFFLQEEENLFSRTSPE